MATMRKQTANAYNDVLGTVSTTATTITKTIGTLGRVSDAGYAYVDAWAADIEAVADARKVTAGANAKAIAISELTMKQKAIKENLESEGDVKAFNENMDKWFP